MNGVYKQLVSRQLVEMAVKNEGEDIENQMATLIPGKINDSNVKNLDIGV